MANHKPDPVDQVIQHVLPRYRDGQVEFSKAYDDDVRHIVKAFQAASTDRRRKLVWHLKKTWQVPCRLAGDGYVFPFQPADDMYFPLDQLQILFRDLARVWLIDPDRRSVCSDQARAVLAACGVRTYLRTVLWSSSETDLHDIRQRLGWKKSEVDLFQDFQIEHLDQILHRISREPKWKDRSFALWNCLHDALRHLGEDFFYGRYEAWNAKRTTRAARFPAYFVRVLRRTAWLPAQGGKPKSPRELSLADLPARFRQTARPFLLQLLQFMPDVRNPSGKADFSTLEISDKPNPVDEVVEHVLPRYQDTAFELPPTYDEDVTRIVEAFHAATPDRRKELVDRLRVTQWAAVKYARSDKTHLQLPWEHYYPSENLQKLFIGIGGSLFIDPRRRSLRGAKARAVLEACGVQSRLTRESGARLSSDELGEIRRRTGWQSSEGEFIDDYSIWDLERVLNAISRRNPGWQDRSFALWDCLHDSLRHCGEDFLWGRYEAWNVKNKLMLRAARFPAYFVRQLQRAAWLPGGKDTPQRPCEMSVNQLPAKFRRGASSAIVRALGFKTGAAPPPDENLIIALEILEGSDAHSAAKPTKAAKRKTVSSGVRSKRASR